MRTLPSLLAAALLFAAPAAASLTVAPAPPYPVCSGAAVAAPVAASPTVAPAWPDIACAQAHAVAPAAASLTVAPAWPDTAFAPGNAVATVAASLTVAPAWPDTAFARAIAAQDEVDAFMREVLARREINWEATYDYVFSEAELLRIEGGEEIVALQSFARDYTWYVREGYLVRSPWRVNGVEVAADRREAEELQWIADIKRDESDARIARDSFFNFEFEPGNYLFAGRETFEGREVVKIEYYPTEAFFEDEDEPEPERERRRAEDENEPEPERERRRAEDEDDEWNEEEFEHMFAKTSLVTLLILPEEHQIVKWTFENVGFEFLPYRSLVRMDELRASMVMDQPIEGVWLPREISASAQAGTAAFDLRVDYVRSFGDYKRPAVGGAVIFGRPKR